jgi:hypothetical protein
MIAIFMEASGILTCLNYFKPKTIRRQAISNQAACIAARWFETALSRLLTMRGSIERTSAATARILRSRAIARRLEG